MSFYKTFVKFRAGRSYNLGLSTTGAKVYQGYAVLFINVPVCPIVMALFGNGKYRAPVSTFPYLVSQNWLTEVKSDESWLQAPIKCPQVAEYARCANGISNKIPRIDRGAAAIAEFSGYLGSKL